MHRNGNQTNPGLVIILLGIILGILINAYDPAPRKRHAGKVLESITQISQKFERGENPINLQNQARSWGMDFKLIGNSSNPIGYVVSFVMADSERVLVATVNKLSELPGEVSVDGIPIIDTTNVNGLIKALTRNKTEISIKVTRILQ